MTPLEVAELRDEAERAHSALTPGDPSDRWSQQDVYLFVVPHLVAVEKLCDEIERLRVAARSAPGLGTSSHEEASGEGNEPGTGVEEAGGTQAGSGSAGRSSAPGPDFFRIFSTEPIPPEDVKRAGHLARERGWADV